MIKAVLFDLGGVYFTDGTAKFLEILAVKTGRSKEELYLLFREGESLAYRRNELSGKEFFQSASEQLNSEISGKELNRLWVSQYTEVPAVRKIVEDLKSKGLKVAVLSDNVPERIDYLQNKYRFLDLFDEVILSYEAGLTKTDPEIYRLTLSRLEAEPVEAVFVDDREINLKVAQKVGLKTVFFTTAEALEKELELLTKIFFLA